MRSLFFIPLLLISCVTQGKILYSYYFNSVEKCVDSSFSSSCIITPAKLDQKNDLPITRGVKPDGISSFVYTFGFTNQVSAIEVESTLNKNCQDINKKGSYYELFINKKLGITTSGELHGWCE